MCTGFAAVAAAGCVPNGCRGRGRGARHSGDVEDVVGWLAQRMDKTSVARLMRRNHHHPAHTKVRRGTHVRLYRGRPNETSGCGGRVSGILPPSPVPFADRLAPLEMLLDCTIERAGR
jgi:hypothetical protein